MGNCVRVCLWGARRDSCSAGSIRRAPGEPEIEVHDRVVDGDRVWSRVTMRGVSFETGQPRTVQWLQIHRVVEGRILGLHGVGGGDHRAIRIRAQFACQLADQAGADVW